MGQSKRFTTRWCLFPFLILTTQTSQARYSILTKNNSFPKTTLSSSTSTTSLLLVLIPLLVLMAATLSVNLPTLSFRTNQITGRGSGLKLTTWGWTPKSSAIFPSTFKTSPLRVSCAAKAETVDKVCEIVRKQLALPADSDLTPQSKFSALGADSLDTVEIVMELEEAFGIALEEDSSQNITTVQEAADLIELLLEKKP